MVMLDSDTCILIMKREAQMKPQAPLDECVISQIVLGELEYGVSNSPEIRQEENRGSLYDFLSAVSIFQLTNEAAAIYGEIRACLRRQGTPIGPNDLWIAAHAVAVGVPLVTNNTREFSRVPNLIVDNWIVDPGDK